jgi:FKBP-type peptidyl-prolyl cis-trans isomerase SlyD
MIIGNATIVEVHFAMKDGDGQLLDSTWEREPFVYLHGACDIIEGLEEILEDLEVGSEFEVTVPPEKGYGIVDPRQITEVAFEDFPEDAELEVGQTFYLESPEGPQAIYIKEMKADCAVIDGNHELAGEILHYKGQVVSIREATSAELKHGTVGSSCCSGGSCSAES